jgi:FkbM family methyltransferase
MSFPEEQAAIKEILKQFEHPTIVDLGAHQGTDEEWMLQVCEPERIMMCEPDPDNFKVLCEKFFPGQDVPFVAYNEKFTVARNCIGPHDGFTDFYASASCGGGFGSMYKPIGGLSVPVDEFHKIQSVICMKFDTFMEVTPPHPEHIDLLWVDIHGAEKDMIAHGQKALSKTRFMFIEYFDNRLYEGMATGSELKAMLPGWELIKTFPWNMLLRNKNTT